MAKSVIDLNAIRMTREGYDRLKEELANLRGDGRKIVAEKLEEARAFGDLSENAEYHAAKEEQEKLENRILELEAQLAKAVVVEKKDIDTSTASIGTTVTIVDKATNQVYTYTLVATEEADIRENRISMSCPVGKAIIGHRVGEVIKAHTPRGIRTLEITDIK
ncbi:MAG: transcription elongation factor GreA [Synergistaceae bacterium]|nr:transcription elongation factor GreA [Synergistaceae bacterium]